MASRIRRSRQFAVLASSAVFFLQVDPVAGGSANDYDYCNQDSVNCYDLAGTWPHIHWKNIGKSVVHVVQKAAPVIGAVGFGVCVFASAGACLVAGAIGVAASGVGHLGGCAISHCSGGQWAMAAGHVAFDAGLTVVGGEGVRANVSFMNRSVPFGAALANESTRNVAIGTGFARFLRQGFAWAIGGAKW